MATSLDDSLPGKLSPQVLDAAQLIVREFDGTILHWSRGMERLYGWSRQEAIGRNSHQLLQTVFPRPLAEIEAQLLEDGEWAGELIHRRRSGERLVVASHWSLWLRVVVEVDNDVTAARHAFEAQRYLANIVDSSDDAIIGKALDGTITSWNQAAQRMFAYTAGEVIGKSISLLAPADRLDEQATIIERIKRGERVDHFETIRKRKNGEVFPVSLTISPIVERDGTIVGASKIVRDISELRQSRDAFLELQSELFHVARLNTISHMASGLAHELNQPLSAITNYLTGALKIIGDGNYSSEKKLRAALEKAAQQTLRAGEIVRRLRNFMSRGETEFKVENVTQLLKEARELALLGVNSLEITLQIDPGSDWVLINKIQIQQVLLNLLRNAIEAMESVETRKLIITTAPADPDTLELTVIDTGPGINSEIAAQLFQPFTTTKVHGMGVGLSISKTIIESHGGRIWIEPNPEGGTIFRLTLPLATKPSEDPIAP